MAKPNDIPAIARLLVRDIQRALKECDVEKAERLVREFAEKVRGKR